MRWVVEMSPDLFLPRDSDEDAFRQGLPVAIGYAARFKTFSDARFACMQGITKGIFLSDVRRPDDLAHPAYPKFRKYYPRSGVLR